MPMSEKTEAILAEIQQNIVDLSGDIIALEAFCRHREVLRLRRGCSAYLRRLEDHTHQHLSEISQLADVLLRAAGDAPRKIPNKIPARTTKIEKTMV